MVRFIQATISGGKKLYFNADRISAILESSRSDSKSILSTSGGEPFQVMEDPATLLQQLGVSSV
jgi:organic radical activating enzyme